MSDIKGKIQSFQSLGTVDGPGVRYVVFMQGCNLRCSCCHNPETWDIEKGNEFSPEDVYNKIIRYKEYFGSVGGITVSGGEPLLQPEFVCKLFELCHSAGINTCLDTSGSVINEQVIALLRVTDRVLLDIKYCDNERYRKHVGCTLNKVLEFLNLLNNLKIPVTVRQVIIPEINGNEDDIIHLKKLIKPFGFVDKIELLPFKKICITKYETLDIKFPFEQMREPSREEMEKLNSILKANL